MRLLLERFSDSGTQTIGRFFVLDSEDFSQFDCPSLELPWKDNQRNVSCIPIGTYQMIKHDSPKFGKCFWLQHVEERSEILIHGANFYTDLRGCMAPGLTLSDLNRDKHIDLVNSKKALTKLLKLLPSRTTIEIINGHGM